MNVSSSPMYFGINIRPEVLKKTLEDLDCRQVRQTGSHIHLKTPDHRPLVFVITDKTVSTGVFHDVADKLGLKPHLLAACCRDRTVRKRVKTGMFSATA